jgi:hypothetical protein
MESEMNKKWAIFLIIIASFVTFTLGIGCNSNSEIPQPLPTYCPDDYIEVNNAVFSLGFDSEGKPIGISRQFSSEVEEIYCTFQVSADTCCNLVIIDWLFNGSIIPDKTIEDQDSFPPYVVLHAPEGGFELGQYGIRMHVGVHMVLYETFSIV